MPHNEKTGCFLLDSLFKELLNCSFQEWKNERSQAWNKKKDFRVKLKLNTKRLYSTKSLACFSIKIDDSLTWNTWIKHVNDITINIKLKKVREIVNTGPQK